MTRDEKGRYVPGHEKSSNGRPSKAREMRYYEITQTAVTFEDWREIVNKAKEQAKRGDAVARKFLADYLIGPLKQEYDVTTAGQPLVIVRHE